MEESRLSDEGKGLRSDAISDTLICMSVLRYRGCQITTQQIAAITALIEANPGISRWKLSRLLCEAWQWKQAKGALRDMVCRSLLLELEPPSHI